MTSSGLTHMDATDIADFLATQHTGVLSLAEGNDSYAIPVSFAHKADEGAVYFRLGYGADSNKRRFVGAVDTASFVVHDQTDEGWKSVVVHGELEQLSENSLDSTVVQSVRDLDIPYFNVFDDASGNLEFVIVRLDAASLTGIVAG
jgi:nitroimidazol reductase NimA-like FMN-containing flavoprotein (pyridoxamine 5'-phosphate oxidase superfamily)